MTSKHTASSRDVEAAYSSLLTQTDADPLALVLNHLELSRQALEWLMQREVSIKAGEPYTRTKPHDGRYSRWGSNPGSFQIGGQRLPVEVPRLHDNENGTTSSPEVYHQVRRMESPPEHVMRGLLLGLSTRRYKEAAELLLDSFGMSKSALSEAFIEHSAQILEGFLQRRLDDREYVAMFIDGKVLRGQSIVVAIGVDTHGEKRTLGLLQATTENGVAIATMLRDMIGRGLDAEHGMLFVIDGGKGLRSAISEVFGDQAIVQRCQVHKTRNVISHLPETEHAVWKKRLGELYACQDYALAQSMADAIVADLNKVNISAARSFQEGLHEVLALARLGLVEHFTKCFSSTNIIESTFSTATSLTRHVKRWTTADQRLRWYAAALSEIEPKWRKVLNHRRLPMLQRAMLIEINQAMNNHATTSKPR